MSNLAVRFVQSIWEHSGWLELNKFVAEAIAHEKEMLVLIRKITQQRDELIVLAEEAIRQRNEAIAKLAKATGRQTFMRKKDENIIQ